MDGASCWWLHALAVLLLQLIGAGTVAAVPLAVVVDEAVHRFDAEALAQAHGQVRLRVHEPHESRERAYVGVWIRDLLDATYGASWRTARLAAALDPGAGDDSPEDDDAGPAASDRRSGPVGCRTCGVADAD